MTDTVASRMKRNPRLCTIRTPKDLEVKMRGMTNRQLWLSQFDTVAEWQNKMIQDECRRREAAYHEKWRGNVPEWLGWWF